MLPGMKDVLVALFSSRKFLIAFIVIVALVPLVYMGRLSIDQFLATVEKLTIALIAAIGVEGAAEKWNATPPPMSAARIASASDSLKPPKIPAPPPGEGEKP